MNEELWDIHVWCGDDQGADMFDFITTKELS